MAGSQMVTLGPTPEFPTLMTDQLTAMRKDGTLTDFTIMAQLEESKLRCHKIVLAIHSPVFRTMFIETSNSTMRYDKFNVKTLRLILDYCYYEEISFPDDQLVPLITASIFFKMAELEARCVDAVRAFLTPDNVLKFFTFAVWKKLPDMKTWCLEIIVMNFPKVSKQPAFLKLTHGELMVCLTELAHSDVKRDDILSAAFNWIGDSEKERAQYMQQIVKQARPENCTMHSILDIMGTHKALIASNLSVFSILTKCIREISEQNELSFHSFHSRHKVKQLVIICGQVNEKVSSNCWILDAKENVFTKLCSVPFHELAKNHCVCEVPEGVALTGGRNSDLCAVYNASAKVWKKKHKMLRKRCSHASIYCAGKLFVLGGSVSDTESASVDCLTMESDVWEGQPDSPVPAGWPKVAALNNKLYMLVIGDTNQLLKFDVKKHTWTMLASLSDVHSTSVSMISVSGQLCVAGGSDWSCAWYNPATDTWSMGQQKPINKHCDGALVLQDNTTLMLLGGSWGSAGTDAIEELNISDGTWSHSPLEMPAQLWGHKAFYLDMPQDQIHESTKHD